MEEAACSRAQAEQLIEGGRVRVNGKVVQDPPTRVEPHDRVEVQGTEAAARLDPATLLLHKPSALTTQAMLALLTEANHQPNDRSGLQLLKKHLSGLVCLTPLEPAASGLVVWSQHPGISRKLQEDASTIEHEALATVRGTVSPEALRILNASAVIDGRAMHSARASINQAQPDHTTLRFAFKGYYPGQVVQLCEHAGLELTALRRLRIGRLPLASLPEGKWRFLLGYERF
jgi:23S rRNA pseudouridine2604 synthase